MRPLICPSFSSLPLELVDRIIDFLHNDKVTLATCALVCKKWVPTSGFHHFSRLLISRPRSELSNFLTSPIGRIQPFLRQLCVGSMTCGWWAADPEIYHGISKCPMLKELNLESLFINPTGPSPSIFQPLLSVTTLKLSTVQASTLSDICSLIGSFLSLERLVLDFIFWNGVAATPTCPAPPSLRHIFLSNFDASEIMAWLSSQKTSFKIKSAELKSLDGGESQFIKTFPSLETVALNLGPEPRCGRARGAILNYKSFPASHIPQEISWKPSTCERRIVTNQ